MIGFLPAPARIAGDGVRDEEYQARRVARMAHHRGSVQTTCRMTPRDDARLRLFVGSVVTLLVVFVFFVVFVFW
jgi:hypothetical protein